MLRINIEADSVEELAAIKDFLLGSTVIPPVRTFPEQTLRVVEAREESTAAPVEQPASEPVTESAVAARKRRSKAEMDAARAAEAAAKQPDPASPIEPLAAQADDAAIEQAVAAAPAPEAPAPTPEPIKPATPTPVPTPAATTAPAEEAIEWDVPKLKQRVAGLQTYAANDRTYEILSTFGITATIPPSPGATITPILASMGVKNLTELIALGADKVNHVVAIYDALMAG